jgi:hypothetical protein
MVQFICKNCGAVNIPNIEAGTEADWEGADWWKSQDWLDCLEPKGFEWKLPAGKITPVVGPAIYISATGEQLSRKEYCRRFNLDPEIAYKFMRTRASRYNPDNCNCDNQQETQKASQPARTKKSSSGKPPKTGEVVLSSPPIRAPAWADEEDWV